MRVVCFSHSLRSCWNHGNAHFLRGVLRDLLARGHDVRSFEPVEGWSLANLRQEPSGPAALQRFPSVFPELAPVAGTLSPDLDAMLDGADLVLVHEWNDPALVAAVGARRKQGGRFRLLFHDTHHRAVTDPEAIGAMDLSGYDGVLAFGATLAEVYRRAGWGARAFVWHEAADTRLFRPPAAEGTREGLVWIGNWGDEERSAELRDYLLAPAAALGLPLDIWGVRYPPAALQAVADAGARYHGWLPNAEAPGVFARHMATVHVPRRAYATQLPGIPTIRMFEALACGIPLVSAPWSDSESLFRPDRDYLRARDPHAMRTHLARLQADPDLRRSLAASGLETIRARHTCAHRVDELLGIAAAIGVPTHPTRQETAA
ncbi:MAG: glycosyltransferase [Rhodospirillales bacterium]|nr:glycosyltransferase [Rhodospirillales bacterium]